VRPPLLPPQTPRERACHRALDRLLAAAVAAGLVLAAAGRARRVRLPALRSLPVDLSRDEGPLLRSLPGIGPGRARAILDDRARNGPLPSLEALDGVPGFGPKTVETLREEGAVATGRAGGP
jgi:competence protein ComEA